MYVVALAGRRGSGKTSAAQAILPEGWAYVHMSSLATGYGCPKDRLGAYVGSAPALSAELSRHHACGTPGVVVDGAPRTGDQVPELLRSQYDTLVICLDASARVAAERLHLRGLDPEAVSRAHVRWLASERPVLAGIPSGMLQFVPADGPADEVAEMLSELLAEHRSCGV